MAPVLVVVGGGAGDVVIISRRVSIVVIVAGGVLAGGVVQLNVAHFEVTGLGASGSPCWIADCRRSRGVHSLG